MLIRPCGGSPKVTAHSEEVVLTVGQIKRITAMQTSLEIGPAAIDDDSWTALILEIHDFLNGFPMDKERLRMTYFRDLPEVA